MSSVVKINWKKASDKQILKLLKQFSAEAMKRKPFQQVEKIASLSMDDETRMFSLAIVIDTLFTGKETSDKLADFQQLIRAFNKLATTEQIALRLVADNARKTSVSLRTCWFEIDNALIQTDSDTAIALEGRHPHHKEQQFTKAAGYMASKADIEKAEQLEVKKGDIFISYTNAEGSQTRVRSLIGKLQERGISSVTDMDWGNLHPPEGWPIWSRQQINQQINQQKWILVWFDNAYLRVMNGEAKPTNNRGIQAEWNAIVNHLYAEGCKHNNRFAFVLTNKSPEIRGIDCGYPYFNIDDDSGLQRLLAWLSSGDGNEGSGKPLDDIAWSMEERRVVGQGKDDRYPYNPTKADAIIVHLNTVPNKKSDQECAIDALIQWINNSKAPPLVALLGDYGMGKTMHAIQLSRQLRHKRIEHPQLPLAYFLDLTLIGKQPDIGNWSLEEIIAFLLKKNEIDPADLDARMIIDAVKEGRAIALFDGLDEVVVHVDDNQAGQFFNTLLSFLPNFVTDSKNHKANSKENHAKVLVSCRTHYFRNLSHQSAFFNTRERGRAEISDYQALFLQPFNNQQIEDYLEKTIKDQGQRNELMRIIEEVYNIKELAQRPYLLSLLTEQVGDLIREMGDDSANNSSTKKPINAATLYNITVQRWIERDRGKHSIQAAHKPVLMGALAAYLWREGKTSLAIEKLEKWLPRALNQLFPHEYAANPHLMTELKQDFRTATFIVREGGEDFHFAHRSFQEYFLARYVLETLEDGLISSKEKAERLTLKTSLNHETLIFLMDLLKASNRSRNSVIQTVQQLWTLPTNEHLEAKKLGLKIAIELDNAELWIPSGDTRLAKNFQGMDLTEWRIGAIDLTGADFSGAWLTEVEFHGTDLSGSQFNKASLGGTLFLDTNLAGADLSAAQTLGMELRNCTLHQTLLPPDNNSWSIAGQLASSPQSAVQWVDDNGDFDGINACAFSFDGQLMVTASNDNTARIWNANNGKVIKILTGHQRDVNDCAFSPDDLLVVTASNDKTARIWNANSGELIKTLTGHQGLVRGCTFSPDGQWVVTASRDRTTRIWDVSSGELIKTLTGHEDGVRGCAFSPDGQSVVTASWDKTARIWDANSGELIKTLEGHQDLVNACVFSLDGQWVVTASRDKTARIWNANNGELIKTLTGHESLVNACAFSPDGQSVVTASLDKTARIWNANNGELIQTLTGHQDNVSACAFSPDGQWIVTASRDKTARIWNANSGNLIKRLKRNQDGVTGCAFSPDGELMITASADKIARIWNTNSGKLTQTFTGHESGGTGCAFSPDGQWVVTASWDKTARIWNANSGELIQTLTGHQGDVNACAFSLDGQWVVTASDDKTARIWNANSGELIQTLIGHQSWVMGCAFSLDGQWVVTASFDKTVRIWNANSGELIRTLEGHQNWVRGCAFSPDGQWVVTASDDETVRIWNANSGELTQTLEGHQSWVMGCAFSPDGELVVTASHDKTARIWNANNGELIKVFEGHQGWVNSCTFSPDGQTVVTSSFDNTARIWDIQTGRQLWKFVHVDADSDATFNDKDELVSYRGEAWRVIHCLIDGQPFPLETGLKAQEYLQG